jgi:hypothetical protein
MRPGSRALSPAGVLVGLVIFIVGLVLLLGAVLPLAGYAALGPIPLPLLVLWWVQAAFSLAVMAVGFLVAIFS